MLSYSDTTNNHVLVCISVVFSFICFFKFYNEFSMILSHIYNWGLSFPNPSMVTVIVSLHECLGTMHGYFGVEPLTSCVIRIADK